MEFTVNSSDLDHVEIAGSKSSVASDRTKVYENLPGDSAETTAGTDTDAGGSTHDPGFGGEKMSATSSRLQSRRTNRMSEAESESLASGRRASSEDLLIRFVKS